VLACESKDISCVLFKVRGLASVTQVSLLTDDMSAGLKLFWRWRCSTSNQCCYCLVMLAIFATLMLIAAEHLVCCRRCLPQLKEETRERELKPLAQAERAAQERC